MKGSKLIDFIKKYNMEDMDIIFSLMDGYSLSPSNPWPNYRTFELDGGFDKGHSGNVAKLFIEEES